MNKQTKLVTLSVFVLMIAGIMIASSMASATNPDGITANQPLGSSSSPATISGTYEFEDTITVATGGSVSNNIMSINGATFTPSLLSTKYIGSTITEYKYGYAFITGSLSNGEYSWYGSADIQGTTYTTATEYFEVANSITISFQLPTAGQLVLGNQKINVVATSTSTNTVQSASYSIGSLSGGLTSGGSGEWTGSFDSAGLINGPNVLTVTATGSGSISGKSSESIVVGNKAPSSWDIIYSNTLGSFSQSVLPQGTGQTAQEGPITCALGYLPLYPNTNTRSVTGAIPGTSAGINSLYLPIDASPYYFFNSTTIDNWTNTSNNHIVVVGGTAGNATPYGTPSITLTASTVSLSTADPIMPANLSAHNVTFGFLFNASAALAMGGISYGLNALNIFPTYASGTSGPAYLTILLTNSSGASEYQIETNQTISPDSWYSVVLEFNHVNANNIASYKNVSIYLDSYPVGYKVTTVSTGNPYFLGLGTVITTSPGQVYADIFESNTILSQKAIGQITTPSPWQIYTPISPPLYTVKQDYYQFSVTNGTQPWSSLAVFVLEVISGEQSLVTISLTSNLGSQNFLQYNVAINYTPFMSLEHYNLTLSSNPFTAPLDSIVSIRVTNGFGQTVGRLNNSEITSLQQSFTVYLSLTDLLFQFVNTTETAVTLSANGISQQFFGSAIVANNSLYVWTIQAFSNGQDRQYSGNVTTFETYQPLTVYTVAPPAALSVIVFAYHNSSLTEVTTGGQPGVLLFLNGKPWQTFASYNTSVGSSINIRVADYLNQTLYSANYSVLNSQNTAVVDITTPSYILSLKNDEQANTSSPKATEIIRVTNNATKVNATFTDAVGQTLTLYLLEANYTLYLHDNATFTTSVYLNQSSYYVIFGQKLLTLSLFTKDMQQILNNSAKLTVTPLRQPSQLEAKLPYSFEYTISFSNGTLLTHLQIYDIIENSTFSIYLSNDGTSIQGSLAVVNKTLYANFTAPSAGSYNFVIQGFAMFYGQIYGASQSGQFSIIQNVSIGFSMAISGPSKIQIATNNTYLISLQYAGTLQGTVLNLSDTNSVAKQLKIEVYYNGLFVGLISNFTVVRPGQIRFIVNLHQNGSYVIVAVASGVKIAGQNASAENFININAVPYNPNGNTLMEQLTLFFDQFGFIIGVIVSVVALGIYIEQIVRHRHDTDTRNEAQVENGAFAIPIYKIVTGQKLTKGDIALLQRAKPDVLKTILQKMGEKPMRFRTLANERELERSDKAIKGGSM